VGETFVGDLHTAVQLQYREVLGDRRARTQAAHTLVSDPTTVRHTLHTYIYLNQTMKIHI